MIPFTAIPITVVSIARPAYDAAVTAQPNGQLIDGKVVSAQIRAELTKQAETLRESGVVPGLAVILVGEDPASQSYVKAKAKASTEIGIRSDIHRLDGSGLPAEIEAETLALIQRLNADPNVDGMIVQLPLPEGVDADPLLRAIDPRKDVDGLHPENQGRLLQGTPRFLPATPHGVQQLLVRTGNDPGGKHVVIAGRSKLVGMPLAAMLLQKRAGANATVTVCHTGTPDLALHTRQAEILVAAVGRPGVITADMVRPGAVVIDVGVNRVDDPSRERGYRLVGDVDFDAVREKASFITPVPGGVGPMTVTMLLTNVVRAARELRLQH